MSYEPRFTPIHKSLHEVKSTGGAEFVLTVANVALLGVMIMGPRFFWWPVVTYLLQKVLQWLFQRDPQMSLVMSRYMREGDTYDPWPRPTAKLRPMGAARDLPLC